jgi:hypothetical protein
LSVVGRIGGAGSGRHASIVGGEGREGEREKEEREKRDTHPTLHTHACIHT